MPTITFSQLINGLPSTDPNVAGALWKSGDEIRISGAAPGTEVTAVSVVSANGISGTSSGGNTPALTLALGAITPTSVAATGSVSGSNLSGTNTNDETYSTITTKLAGGSGGGTTNFFRADGTFAATPITPPAGSTTQIQFNDAGAFGADADFTWNSSTNDLVLGGTDTGITLAGITTEPASPAAGTLHFYAKAYAGKMLPKIKGPSGLDLPLQVAMWGNKLYRWQSTNATGGVWEGTVGAAAGTFNRSLPTTTNLYTSVARARYANVVTTTNQVLGQRNTEAIFFRGSVASQGGFFFYARCGFDIWTNGSRFFAGMHTATTVVSADPSTLNNTVGFCIDAADNGAISFLTRGTAATKAATGFTAATNKGYDVYIFCAPNSSQYTWRIVDFTAGTEASGTATATLPTNTTLQTAGVLASNAALTPVNSIQLGVDTIYVETDY